MRILIIAASAALMLSSLNTSAQIEWKAYPVNEPLNGVIFHEGEFFAMRKGGFAKSRDGVSWEFKDLPECKNGWVYQIFGVKGGVVTIGYERYWGPDGMKRDLMGSTNYEGSSAYLNGVGILAKITPTLFNGQVTPAMMFGRWSDESGKIDGVQNALPHPYNYTPWVVGTEFGFLIAAGGKTYASSDGKNWEQKGTEGPYPGRPFYWSGSLYSRGSISRDLGKTWENRALNNTTTPIAAGGGYIFSGFPNSGFATSKDGEKWVARITPANTGVNGVAFGNGIFVASTTASAVLVSDPVASAAYVTAPELNITPDGISWLSKMSLRYQPQRSIDLKTWENFGDSIAGDGTEKSVVYDRSKKRRYFRLVVE